MADPIRTTEYRERVVTSDVSSTPTYEFSSSSLVVIANHMFQVLRAVFVVIPILAGLDKFLHFIPMNDVWAQYLAPSIPATLGVSAATFMQIVGGIEIVAGLIVMFAPTVGGSIVAAWLAAIVVNLFMRGSYFDIALRDLGLMSSAICFARLSHIRNTFLWRD